MKSELFNQISFHDSEIKDYKKDDNNCFKGKVEGSDDQIYDIDININHPRKSHCNCPFA